VLAFFYAAVCRIYRLPMKAVGARQLNNMWPSFNGNLTMAEAKNVQKLVVRGYALSCVGVCLAFALGLVV